VCLYSLGWPEETVIDPSLKWRFQTRTIRRGRNLTSKSTHHIHHIESQAYGRDFRFLCSTMAAELNIDFSKAKSFDFIMCFAQEHYKFHILNSLRASHNWKLWMCLNKHLFPWKKRCVCNLFYSHWNRPKHS